jgi:hypothetical protein
VKLRGHVVLGRASDAEMASVAKAIDASVGRDSSPTALFEGARLYMCWLLLAPPWTFDILVSILS